MKNTLRKWPRTLRLISEAALTRSTHAYIPPNPCEIFVSNKNKERGKLKWGSKQAWEIYNGANIIDDFGDIS